MKAWLFQDPRQKKRLGEKKCPWSVGWYDPEGRKKSKRIGARSYAEKYRRKLEGQLAAGTYETETRESWLAFRERYEETIMPKWRSEVSRMEARRIFRLFEKIAKPLKIAHVDQKKLDSYVASRLKMRGKRKGDLISRSTIKKELRTVRAALGIAKKWKLIQSVPDMPEIEDFRRDKPFVTAEHFDAIYAACDGAIYPADQHYSAGDFWRALLGLAMTTGMRKSAMLYLLWEDVDFEHSEALSRAEHNKGKRDYVHDVDPVAHLLAELHRLRSPGDPRVFAWNLATRSLDRELIRIQQAAKIRLPCRESHEHTESCYTYGFHSFRYGLAQHNLGRLSRDELQEQMGHRSATTTDLYIDYAKRQKRAKVDVFRPASLQASDIA